MTMVTKTVEATIAVARWQRQRQQLQQLQTNPIQNIQFILFIYYLFFVVNFLMKISLEHYEQK